MLRADPAALDAAASPDSISDHADPLFSFARSCRCHGVMKPDSSSTLRSSSSVDWGPFGTPIRRVYEVIEISRFFLVRHGNGAQLAPSRTVGLGDRARDVDDVQTGDLSTVIHPIAMRPHQRHPFISVGRLDGNDIGLSDQTVSKFHAFIKEGPGATLVLQDARSRNGTFVNGVAVPGRGLGPPTALNIGDSVRFGSIVCSFVDAELLRRLFRGAA
jgi:hypothetical protein